MPSPPAKERLRREMELFPQVFNGNDNIMNPVFYQSSYSSA